jgi:hypothetical protein
MMRALRWAAGLIPAALLAAGLQASCATLHSSRRIDVAPFAENTLGMLGELQKFNRPTAWTHLRKYQTLPSVIAAGRSIFPIRDLLRGVGLYSEQIVSLYESPLSETRKVSEMARYMEEIIRPSLASADATELRMSQADLDAVVQDIRTRRTLLSALGAAQPLVNATMVHGNVLFDRVDSLVQAAEADVGARIEANFRPLKERIEDLDSMHVASVRSYALVQRYRRGDKTALDSLHLDEPGLVELLPLGRRPTPKELDSAERYVVERSTTINSLRDQLAHEFAVYRESQAELEALRTQTDERARLGRIALNLWGSSHRNLAEGISVPPMIDVVGLLKTVVTSGVERGQQP